MRGKSVREGMNHSVIGIAAAILALQALPVRAVEIVVKGGDSIAFMGDSITEFGVMFPVGYVHLVMRGLESQGIKATLIPAGRSGHKSNDMLARLQADVIDKKPTWMTLSCGVNDVWHGANGIPLPQYKTNITAIVDKCQTAGIKVMILTATVIGEQENPNNTKLAEYNDFLRSLAKEKKCLLADLNADLWAGLKGSAGKSNVFTCDGVHMAPEGNILMASGILRTFGMTQPQIAKAEDAWRDVQNAVKVHGEQGLNLKQFAQLKALADKQNLTTEAMINKAFADVVDDLLKASAVK